MRNFKPKNWIDIRGLNATEKQVLVAVMKYNGVNESLATFEDCFESSWHVVFIEYDGTINACYIKDAFGAGAGCNNLQQCNELTPQEAAFMGAPDSVTVVGKTAVDRIFWFDSINKAKPLHGWRIVTSESPIILHEIEIPDMHGWTENDVIFKRDKVMSNVDKQIEKMQAELDELKLQRKQELEAAKKVEKWKPIGGQWYVAGWGEVRHTTSQSVEFRDFGVERGNRDLAEKAAKQMRTFNRILAYVHEHAPDYEWQANKDNCYIQYCSYSKKYFFSQHKSKRSVGFVYMPKDVANKLTYGLNNGTVEL